MNRVNALCFEGGAFWGIGYMGALPELFRRINRDNIKSYCGTSVGAVFAFALALGLSPQQIEDVFWKFRSRFIMRLPFIAMKVPWNLVMNFGLVHNDVLRQGVLMILREVYPLKNDITFKDLDKDLIIPFTVLTDSYYVVGSRYSTPDMSVVDAVTYSCSGNLAFTPNYLNLIAENKKITVVDGGVSNINYPVGIYSNKNDPDYIINTLDNNHTQAFYAQYGGKWADLYKVIKNQDDNQLIGLRFGNPRRWINTSINNLITYLWVFSNVTVQSMYSGVGAENRFSIWIDTKRTFSFDITNIILPNRINRLKDAGKQAVITSKIFT
jgi:predicted acylesterase/phospholipase RssA